MLGGYIEAEVGAMTDTSNRDGLAAMCQVHLDAGATAFDAALAAVDQHVLSRAPAAFDASLGAGACASVLATFGGAVEAACSLEYLEDLGSFVLQRVVALSACAVTKVASGGTGLSSRIREVSAVLLSDFARHTCVALVTSCSAALLLRMFPELPRALLLPADTACLRLC